MRSTVPYSFRGTPTMTVRLLAVALITAMVAMYGPFDRLAQASNADDEDVNVAELSGEDIFRATFLGNGPAASLMPEMQRFRAEMEGSEDYDAREAAEAETELMRILRKSDEAFFDTVRAGFTSGDPTVVSQTQSYAADQVLAALYEYKGLDPATIPEDMAVGIAVVVVAIAVVVVVVVAVAVAVVFWVVGVKASLQYDAAYETVDMDEYDELIDSYSGSLDRDVYVADVTTAFALSGSN